MTNRENYRLCGGTFFTLILQARKQRMGVRDHYLGKSDGLSDPSVLLGLAKVVAADWQDPLASAEKTIKGNTSRYKACKAAAGTYFPFEDSGAVASFDDQVKNNYESCLTAMNVFADTFLEMGTQTKKDEYLVKALVEVIDADREIADTQVFYVREDGSTMTKMEILSATELCLQPFLLGLWHYIIVNVQDNRVGAATYNCWCPSRGGAERLYIAKLGETSGRDISLTYSTVTDIETERKTEPLIDAEVLEPAPGKVEPQPSQMMVNNNPVFNTFNFNGPVGQFFNHVDQITNNYYEGKKDE